MLSAEWLATPIDHALPVMALLVVAIAVALRGTKWPAAILCALPLLAGCAISFPDARQRLLAYGIVFAVTYCGALFALDEPKTWQCALLALVGIALLRWIARDKVEVTREIVIAAGALLIVFVMRRTPLAIAVAVLAAFWSPAIPARTALAPFAVIGCWLLVVGVLGLRFSQRSTTNDQQLSAFLLFLPLALFAWSGVAARAPRYFFRESPRQRIALNFALKPGEAIDVDVPERAKSLAVSLANGLQFKRGTVVGTIEGRAIKTGTVADWGFMRREQWFRSRNKLPRKPAGVIRGYGYDAWVDGAGRVTLPPKAKRIHIVADTHLPADARLQIEAFEQ